jgi:hypothetical protein
VVVTARLWPVSVRGLIPVCAEKILIVASDEAVRITYGVMEHDVSAGFRFSGTWTGYRTESYLSAWEPLDIQHVPDMSFKLDRLGFRFRDRRLRQILRVAISIGTSVDDVIALGGDVDDVEIQRSLEHKDKVRY